MPNMPLLQPISIFYWITIRYSVKKLLMTECQSYILTSIPSSMYIFSHVHTDFLPPLSLVLLLLLFERFSQFLAQILNWVIFFQKVNDGFFYYTSCHYQLFLVFLIYAIPTGMRWHLRIFWSCIFMLIR